MNKQETLTQEEFLENVKQSKRDYETIVAWNFAGFDHLRFEAVDAEHQNLFGEPGLMKNLKTGEITLQGYINEGKKHAFRRVINPRTGCLIRLSNINNTGETKMFGSGGTGALKLTDEQYSALMNCVDRKRRTADAFLLDINDIRFLKEVGFTRDITGTDIFEYWAVHVEDQLERTQVAQLGPMVETMSETEILDFIFFTLETAQNQHRLNMKEKEEMGKKNYRSVESALYIREQHTNAFGKVLKKAELSNKDYSIKAGRFALKCMDEAIESVQKLKASNAGVPQMFQGIYEKHVNKMLRALNSPLQLKDVEARAIEKGVHYTMQYDADEVEEIDEILAAELVKLEEMKVHLTQLLEARELEESTVEAGILH